MHHAGVECPSCENQGQRTQAVHPGAQDPRNSPSIIPTTVTVLHPVHTTVAYVVVNSHPPEPTEVDPDWEGNAEECPLGQWLHEDSVPSFRSGVALKVGAGTVLAVRRGRTSYVCTSTTDLEPAVVWRTDMVLPGGGFVDPSALRSLGLLRVLPGRRGANAKYVCPCKQVCFLVVLVLACHYFHWHSITMNTSAIDSVHRLIDLIMFIISFLVLPLDVSALHNS